MYSMGHPARHRRRDILLHLGRPERRAPGLEETPSWRSRAARRAGSTGERAAPIGRRRPRDLYVCSGGVEESRRACCELLPDALVLAEGLRRFTATPVECWFCLWEGYDLQGTPLWTNYGPTALRRGLPVQPKSGSEQRREWDLNPRGLSIPKLFKSFAFGRSAIPPRVGRRSYSQAPRAQLRTRLTSQPSKWSLRLWIQLSAANQAALAASRLRWPCAPPAG
jgi:hypothetical protein